MFRQLFLLFSTTLGKRDLPGAERLATQALAITTAQGWHALSMPIHMALAAVLGGEQRNSEAEARYLAAEAAASAGVEAGDASCAKLRVQARMARGGLLISAKEHERAAQLYVETVPMAQALGDARMVIDCQRLASFSREQGGDLRAALRHGMEVTEFARGVGLRDAQHLHLAVRRRGDEATGQEVGAASAGRAHGQGDRGALARAAQARSGEG
jgi:hypothetical protein